MLENERYDEICSKQFAEINGKLDSLISKLISGNGQPSLMVRVDRLEQCKESTSKAFWIAISAFITAVAGAVWEMFFKNHR